MLTEAPASSTIERFCRQNIGLHLYELGDLDPFFAPHACWYGWGESGALKALGLIYSGATVPVLLCFSEDAGLESARRMLRELSDRLPKHLYVHLSPGLLPVFDDWKEVRRLDMQKMLLTQLDAPEPDLSAVEPLGIRDIDELRAFYDEVHADNWFDPRTVETGFYSGIRRAGRLVSVAGIHVHSRARRVAALGNVATRPANRGQGLAKATSFHVCERLLREVDVIGLNVEVSNAAANQCYRSLGFRECAQYVEAELARG